MTASVAPLTPTHERRHSAPRPGLLRRTPQAGDILACERSARADVFSIGIVGSSSEVVMRRYAEAIALVKALARSRRVDGWFTCDHTNYARIASHRA